MFAGAGKNTQTAPFSGWGGGTVNVTMQHPADLWACYEPTQALGTGQNNPPGTTPITAFAHMQTMTLPYGQPGFQFTCTDSDVAPWDSTCKAILAQSGATGSLSNADQVGHIAQWTTWFYFPTQTFDTRFFCGLIWELHSNANQANSLQLDTSQHGTPSAPWYKFYNQYDSGGNNTTATYVKPGTNGFKPFFGTWHQLTCQYYLTATTNGFRRWYVDGQLAMSYTGQTYWSSFGPPNCQFGFYSDIGQGLTNQVYFGPTIRMQLAALGS